MKPLMLPSICCSILLILLIGSCAGTPSTAVLPRAEQYAGAASPDILPNTISSRGVQLALPEGWQMIRAGTWLHPTAPQELQLPGAPVYFASPNNTYTGVFSTVTNTDGIEPNEYLSYFMETLVPPSQAVELLRPNRKAGRGWYLLRWGWEKGTVETAFWFGRGSGEEVDMNTVYILALQVAVDGTGEGRAAEQAEREAGNGQDQVPELPDTERQLRDLLFQGIRMRPENLEQRVIPGRVRFISSSAWRWLADVHGGVLLAGPAAGRHATTAVFPAPEGEEAAKLLRKLGGMQELAEVQSFSCQILINNRGIPARAAGVRTEDGGVLLCYLLPELAEGQSWCAVVRIEGPGRPGGSPQGDDSEDRQEESRSGAPRGKQGNPPLPVMEETHRLPALSALFQRQLFFNLEARQ